MQLLHADFRLEAEWQIGWQHARLGVGLEQPIDQGLEADPHRHEDLVAWQQLGGAAGHQRCAAAQDQGDHQPIGKGKIAQPLASDVGSGLDGVVEDLPIHLAQGMDFDRKCRGGIGGLF